MTNILGWIYLLIAIFAEVAGITSMKLSDGFTRLEPSILIFCFYSLSLIFLALSLKRFEISFAYAAWAGVGTLLIFIVGIWMFHESVTWLKVISLFCIIIGLIGLRREV